MDDWVRVDPPHKPFDLPPGVKPLYLSEISAGLSNSQRPKDSSTERQHEEQIAEPSALSQPTHTGK